MSGHPFKLRRLILLAALLPLLGCSFTRVLTGTQSRVQPEPTTDLNPVRTQAAETVVAYITLDAELNPSPTISPTRTRRPPTATTTPTPTEAPPTATIVMSPTISPTRTNPPVPTRTLTLFIQDQARLYDQKPKDYTVLPAGVDFDIVWVVKNTGSREWTKKYAYKYSEGVKGYRQERYFLQEPVPRQNETQLTVDMIAPKEPGRYVTRWVLVNDRDIAFATFYFSFFVEAK